MDSASVHPLPSRDPVSGGRLVITELEGPETGITIRGRFEMPRFAELSPEQSRYLETFLRCRGMLNSVERELGISYPTARARLDAVLRALDLHEVREENGTNSETSTFEPVSFDPPIEEPQIEEPSVAESPIEEATETVVAEPLATDPVTIETIFDEPVAPFEPVVGEPPAIEETEWQATAPEGTVFENAAFEESVEEAAPEETEPRRSRDEILTLLERGEITPEEAKRELAK